MSQTNHEAFTIVHGESPLIAAAVHDGHEVRADLADRFALADAERLREEDPFTGTWTTITDTRILARRSRFEVDLNRPRDAAVYRGPEQAWGLEVWKEPLSGDERDRSLVEYDEFYSAVRSLLDEKRRRHGRFVVYDLHSYNHRRDGPDAEPADPDANPEVNVGTGTMDRESWAPIVDRLISDLRSIDFMGRRLDVRENVKFQGGEFPAWVHRAFPDSGCAIAIEFKKFFMDEWTGRGREDVIDAIRGALEVAAEGTLEELASR